MGQLKQTYFKMFGQKTGNGKMIIVAVVNDDFFGEVPSQFECQAIKIPETIYTGTYPTLKINKDTIIDVGEEMRGKGIDGVITTMKWYCSTRTQNDVFNISITS